MSCDRLVVVKVGGGLSATAGALARAGRVLAEVGRRHRMLVVPGGGPFADAVRDFERGVKLSPSASHWMAVLAMDQYAYAIADVTMGAVVVESAMEIEAALAAGQIPVLAPSRWMRAADVLPHSWDVTSDSIAAFIAGAMDAARLVLVKPADGAVDAVVDAYFATVVPADLPVTVVSVARLDELAATLDRDE